MVANLRVSARFLLVPVAIAALLGATQPSGSQPVFGSKAYLTTPVGGLERTNAEAKIVPAAGQSFTQALRVVIRKAADESNATQLTVMNESPVVKGDVLLAELSLRGRTLDGKAPARIELLFERATAPWTKSVTQAASAAADPAGWKKVYIPFQAAESYQAGQAMTSIRMAFEPQALEIGGLKVSNFGKSRTLDQLVELTTSLNKLGDVAVRIDRSQVRQTMVGLGGNFCQPRYGSVEPMDAVGAYVLKNLKVAHARVGLPLEKWNPAPGVYEENAQSKAVLLALQDFAKRGIPTVVSVWEGPGWMLGGNREQSGRTLPVEKYQACAEAIARFLAVAKNRYGASPEYFSFNEPDYGVNFRFTPAQMAAFIRVAIPAFRAAGVKTKFLVADTANGGNFYAYALPLLQDKGLAPHLGPISFHSWDALGATDLAYTRIAELGRRYKKPVWCLEAGHDAQLWQAPNPWGSWENGLRTAMAYERTIRLTGASLMDYWTYQDNYPLVDKSGKKPYAVFQVMRQMEQVFSPGAKVVSTRSGNDSLQAIATFGPKAGHFSVLLVNTTGAGRAVLSGLPPRAKVQVLLSDRSGQRRKVASLPVDAKGRLAVALPSRSVATVVSAR